MDTSDLISDYVLAKRPCANCGHPKNAHTYDLQCLFGPGQYALNCDHCGGPHRFELSPTIIDVYCGVTLAGATLRPGVVAPDKEKYPCV